MQRLLLETLNDVIKAIQSYCSLEEDKDTGAKT
jgi:hypothetical protein